MSQARIPVAILGKCGNLHWAAVPAFKRVHLGSGFRGHSAWFCTTMHSWEKRKVTKSLKFRENCQYDGLNGIQEVVIQKRGHARHVTKGDVTISYKRLKEQLSEKDMKPIPAPF